MLISKTVISNLISKMTCCWEPNLSFELVETLKTGFLPLSNSKVSNRRNRFRVTRPVPNLFKVKFKKEVSRKAVSRFENSVFEINDFSLDLDHFGLKNEIQISK